MLKELALLYFLCFRFVLSQDDSQTCSMPAEEGGALSFECYANALTKGLGLELKRRDKFEKVTFCTIDGKCNVFSPNYEIIFKKEMKKIDGVRQPEYHAISKIKKTNRETNAFRCVYDDFTTDSCEMDIFQPPMKPTCVVGLSKSEEHVTITCKTDRVYPKAGCIFSTKKPEKNYTVQVEYNHSKSPISSDDMSTKCVTNIPVKTFTQAQYQFRVNMHSITKDGPAMDKEVSSDWSPFQLKFPKVALASDCPVGPGVENGLIEKSTTATCGCVLADKGKPAGSAQWYTSSGAATGDVNPDGSASVKIKFNPSDPKPSYKCQATTRLQGTPKPVVFSPLFYVKPVTPSCTGAVMNPSDEFITVLCGTDQVYPKAGCIFSTQEPRGKLKAQVSFSNSKSSVNPGDVSTKCNGTILLKDITEGQYQFKVSMYADLGDGHKTNSIDSDPLPPLDLSLPTVAIAKNCPVGPGVEHGLIKNGSTATCKCEVTIDGYPSGHAQWYTSDGAPTGTLGRDRSATLELKFDGSVRPKKPICDRPVLNSSNNEVSVLCETNHVSSNAECVFATKMEELIGAVEKHRALYDKTDDNVITKCIDIRKHYYRLPKVALADDCPNGSFVKNGFIKKWTRATCNCELTTKGIPPGHAQWYTSAGDLIGTKNLDGSATLPVAYDDSNPKASYKCCGNSVIVGKRYSVGFLPNFTDPIASDKRPIKKDESPIHKCLGLACFWIVIFVAVVVAVVVFRKKRRYDREREKQEESSSVDPSKPPPEEERTTTL